MASGRKEQECTRVDSIVATVGSGERWSTDGRTGARVRSSRGWGRRGRDWQEGVFVE